jgi:hypothetical protein
MTLKAWSQGTCPLKSLVDGVNDFWTLSSTGTNEYYYNVGDLPLKPNGVYIDGVLYAIDMSPGSLPAGSFGYGYNDVLEKETLYVRLNDDSDPNTKEAGYIKCSNVYDVLVVPSEKTATVFSVVVSNYSLYDANIDIFISDYGGNILSRKRFALFTNMTPFCLDSMMVLESDSKYQIMSSVEDVSIYISGDEN